MGTREVYEEKLRRGNLHHDPTIRPGLGSARCPRCLSLLNPTKENSEWEITPVLHDATAVRRKWYFRILLELAAEINGSSVAIECPQPLELQLVEVALTPEPSEELLRQPHSATNLQRTLQVFVYPRAGLLLKSMICL